MCKNGANGPNGPNGPKKACQILLAIQICRDAELRRQLRAKQRALEIQRKREAITDSRLEEARLAMEGQFKTNIMPTGTQHWNY